MAGKEHLGEELPISGGPLEEVDGEEADVVSSGLHAPALKQEEETVDPKKEQEDGKLIAATGDGDGGEEEDSEEIKWVEMPQEHLLWILGKTRETDPAPTLEDFHMHEGVDSGLIREAIASLQAAEDDFFEMQAWVREVFARNGRVMVPEGVFGPKDELQQQVDEYWSMITAGTTLADSSSEEAEAPPPSK